MVVRKRDGRLADFDSDKILQSIKKAALAVEGKDEDIQRKSNEIRSLKKQLIEHGFSPDVAEEQAEEQFDGYMEDGNYTEYDEEEAEVILGIVVEALNSMDLDDDEIIETDAIQDLVERAMMETGHVKTAKEYIIKRANRERIREMNTSLMRSFEDLTFGKSKDVETKRENANIDGDSSMGTMLKYGSEGAKKFNLLYVVPPEESKAHSDGDIHIHDLDFYSLTETCTVEHSIITLRNVKTGEVRAVRAGNLDVFLADKPDDTVVKLEDIEVFSKGKFVRALNCIRHPVRDKAVLKVRTKTGELSLTSDHVLPIQLEDKIKDIRFGDIGIGDRLVSENVYGIHNLDKINLIKLFGPTNEIVISNTKYVLDKVKEIGKWKQFCTLIGYGGRANSIRSYATMLTLNDYYQYIVPLGVIDESELLLSYRRTRGNETINAVLSLTRELGKFIGYMISEGSITIHYNCKQNSPEKKACFTNYSEELISDFNNCVSTVFNNPVIRNRYTDGKHTGTHLSGYLAYELFHGPFGIKEDTGNIELPEWVYSANKEFLNGFLGALIDGDGHVEKYSIRYSSASETLIEGIQKLLLINGITSKITKQELAGTEAVFGDKVSIRNYDIYTLNIRSNLKDVDSFKISKTDVHIKDNQLDTEVVSIEKLDYTGYVYDIETENHYFSANGFTVHNCCQIDLEKLFNGGFNTGHGFLREPGEIRSYAALACIAIQSNQNDQHKRVA